jgi:uncharacterized protein (UPF0332 family)
MSKDEDVQEIVRYWTEKAHEALNSAQDELNAGRFSFSVNRLYYACFYAVSAVLLQRGFQFKKHSGVRAAFHKHLVKSGLVSHDHGRLYDELFEARQRGDYIELVRFTEQQVKDWLQQATQFVNTITSLIKK